jgi:anti-anti-sigma regulatory factor
MMQAIKNTTGWMHTVVLTGRLTDASAPELEDEIECLYQEGVTSLTVDLRGLDEVGADGLRALAALNARYTGPGHGLAAIADREEVREQLTAGGTALAPMAEEDADGEEMFRRLARITGAPGTARSTTAVMELC